MPAKNVENYIDECIDSIVNQTYSYWELIVVDDGSSDATLSKLFEWSSRDSRIKVFQNSGIGIIDALVFGENVASGQLITRMDSDDKMTVDKLQLFVDQMQASGPGHVAVGLVKYFADFEIQNGYREYEKWLNDLTICNSNYSQIFKECVIPSPNWIMFRNDFDRIGGFGSAQYPEDYDLCFRMWRFGIKVVGLNKITHFWRDYAERTSRNDPNYLDNMFLSLKVKYLLEYSERKENMIVWGAGRKGKSIARIFSDQNVAFRWVCNSESKWGRHIYGVELEPTSRVSELVGCVVLVLVAGPAQKEVVEFLQSNNIDYLLFC